MSNFIHLHVHTNYSILDGMSRTKDLIKKCQKYGMNALAITDHGNMFGIKEFSEICESANDEINKEISKKEESIKTIETKIAEGSATEEEISKIETYKSEILSLQKQHIKPIIGCEAYCARRTLYDKDPSITFINENGKAQKTDASGYHLILLAKNAIGYQNLCMLISIAWIDGNYYRPRIDKNILKQYHEGLIVCSACLGGEIPQLIMAGKLKEAEESILWFKEIFGDDYYLEIQRHKTDKPGADQNTYQKQMKVNEKIIELARKTNTKIVATNDVHFVEEKHGDIHDLLICLSTKKDINDPNRMRYTKQEWLKTPDEMAEIFSDIPEALENTLEIANKVEVYNLDRDPLMPVFSIPEEFGTEEEYRKKFSTEDLFNEFTRDENNNVVLSEKEANDKIKKLGGYDRLYRIKLEADYLKELTIKGAKKRYGDPIPENVMQRIIFELHVMKTMGFPGYFLIVQDFIIAARNMNVSVGPGRGSAAGSVVAYCLTITDIDPIKYDLLFERFLNPDRISLSDIDIDFDDDGRNEVLKWVTEKYGKDKVAHIITYGTMATKSSIKDVARVNNIPLDVVKEITDAIPDKFPEDKVDAKGKPLPVNINNCIKEIPFINDLYNNKFEIKDTLDNASLLEGTVRQTGIHACGVIIGADDLRKFAPLSTAIDKKVNEEVLVTQYSGKVIEKIGLIKMDFLGLSTLSIIKEALKNIKHSKGIDIDINKIPIDDPLTFELFSKGKTIGVFQFESPGMQKYLKDLKPSKFEDLIAMNALYRPGPMENIPNFIARKHGLEEIKYDIPCMKQYLEETYGITVYQEQVMLLSRLLGNFTRGESDTLRKAMGKKNRKMLDKMKPQFINNGVKNNHDPIVLEKIWGEWEKFASYAFNKSHATCYAWVAYQTAYLKAHYPAEYMAANLTRNKDDIKEITKFMTECKQLNIPLKGPDINESELNFSVTKDGCIRFGLAGIKGVGEGPSVAIINEREQNGFFKNTFNFLERIDTRSCNKKTIESLGLSGAFDNFNDISRTAFIKDKNYNEKKEIILDKLVQYSNDFQKAKNHNTITLFDDFTEEIETKKPLIIPEQEVDILEKLKNEADVIGVYISAHPLDLHKNAIKYGTSTTIEELKEKFDKKIQSAFTIGGITTSIRKGKDKNGYDYAFMTISDYTGEIEIPFFTKKYIEFKNYFEEKTYLLIKGEIKTRWSDSKYKPKNADSNQEFDKVISNISLIDDTFLSSKKELIITIKSDILNSEINHDLYSVILPPQSKGGNQLLTVNYIDMDNNTTYNLKSHKRIIITNELINALELYCDKYNIEFKLN